MSDFDTSSAIRFNVQPFSCRRWRYPRSPNDGLARDALPRDDHTLAVDQLNSLSEHDFYAQLPEPIQGGSRELRRKCAERTLARIKQNDSRRSRIDTAKVPFQCAFNHDRDCAGHFDARRSGAYQDKRQQIPMITWGLLLPPPFQRQ